MSDREQNSQPDPRDVALHGASQAAPQLAPQLTPSVRCDEVESLAVLRACDELDEATLAALDAHLASCPACAAIFSREARLQAAIASLEQPADSLDRSGLLLAQCRSELAESLDDREARANRTARNSIFSPAAWWGALRYTLIYHPAMSMAVLVVVGFLAGVAGQRLPVTPLPVAVTRPAAPTTMASTSTAPAQAPFAPNKSSNKVTDEQLRSADSAHVAWVTPSGSQSPTVQVQLMSPTPMNIVGAPDDAEVQRALTFLLENGQRFDPDVRLDSLDVLRRNAADPDVRRTLCATARLDRNPGVRIKALEALQGFERDPAVRDALLDALDSDANSGVRVAAIHLLYSALKSDGALGASGSPDPQMLEVLRDRLRNDPSPVVRQQSAAALHQFGIQ